jgi:NAD(P)-dependent dehydrogenase (short-subunit alcohol dehydrogenase family)
LIAAAYDPDLVREMGQHLAQSLADHLVSTQSGIGPVLNWEDPPLNIAAASRQIASGDTVELLPDNENLVQRFDDLIQQSLAHGQNLHHPHYVGHQVPASIPLAALFDAATTLTNQVMAIYEMGPWATAIERAVVNRLGQAIGFPAEQFGGLDGLINNAGGMVKRVPYEEFTDADYDAIMDLNARSVLVAVRRQSFWFQRQHNLGEYLAHLVGFIMRRVCGVASAGLRVFCV